ncbi:endonuclease [Thermococcus sp. P6]|uniref:GIY-YIG nuclease family protein n=1 Tax=Thermococcus sp. P6 TaxID=122420 RepID=UPI000B59CC83|nr:DUF123 domain-containing protein [Thermococcus sp. P6]ASJ11015.1 endonuclease [Thermococcus sp. P6]
MRGSYFLVIRLPAETEVRTRGRRFRLKAGYYVYVGSAMNSLEKRVARHFRRNKKLHWHIDFLLRKAQLLRAYMIPSDVKLEERLSLEVSRFGEPVNGFGAGDVGVKSNLYRFKAEPDAFLTGILEGFNLEWVRVKSEEEAINPGGKDEA